MCRITLVAAIDEQFGLGKNNALLCHLPADLRHFKKVTLGKPIVMGRKTFESIGKPLPGRENLVISSRSIPGVVSLSSLAEALLIKENADELMIIGGGKLFNEAIGLAHRIYLTIIHHEFEADVFFPKFSMEAWQSKKIAYHHRDLENPYDMSFYLLKRKSSFLF